VHDKKAKKETTGFTCQALYILMDPNSLVQNIKVGWTCCGHGKPREPW